MSTLCKITFESWEDKWHYLPWRLNMLSSQQHTGVLRSR